MSSTLYFAPVRDQFPLGPHKVLLRCGSNTIPLIAITDSADARVLTFCQGAKPLDAHARAALRAGANSSPAALAETVRRLAAIGFLRAYEAGPITPSINASLACPPIPEIAIITADRPVAFRRCLLSLIRNCDDFQHRPRIWVIDGSVTSSARAAIRNCVLQEASQQDIRYVGPEEVSTLCSRIASAGIPAPRVLSGLSLGSPGANRNIALLVTAGRNLLMLDDDIVVEPWRSHNAVPGALLGGHRDPYEWSFFRTREEAVRAAGRAQIDLVTAHHSLLGRSLGESNSQLAQPAISADTCSHLLSAMLAGQPRTVRITCAGLAGDSASVPELLLFQTGDVREQLCDIGTFENAMGSREVHHIAPITTVTDDPGCKAYCIGVFNETTPPPFIPEHRNEDGVFGVMMLATDPSSLIGHLSVGVIHDSHRHSAYGRDRGRHAHTTAVSEFLIGFVRVVGPSLVANSVITRIVRLGQLLRDVASLSVSDFEQLVARTILNARCHVVSLCESQALRDGFLARHWRAELDRYTDTFERAIRHRDFFCPHEFRNGPSVDAGFDAMRAYVGEVGGFMEVWPDVWRAAAAAKGEIWGGEPAGVRRSLTVDSQPRRTVNQVM